MIKEKPVKWDRPLTKLFNNNVVMPTSKPTKIEVVKYVRALNPFGEEVSVKEVDMERAESLGLSLRRIQ